MTRSPRWLIAVVALIAAPACTASTPDPPGREVAASERTSTGLWTPTSSTDGDLTRLGLYGGPVKGGGSASIAAISSSGRFITSIRPDTGTSGPLLTGTTQMGWWLPGEEPTMITAPKPPGPSQLVAADAHDDTVIWRETRSTNLEAEDWRILAQSPVGGPAAQVIASYDNYYGADVVPMFNDDPHPLALVEDRAYWSIRDWPTDAPNAPEQRGGLYPDRPTYRILTAPVDGSKKTSQVALGAYGPARAGDRLIYIADDRLITGRTSGIARIVEAGDLRSRTVRQLRASTYATRITMTCGTSTYIAWAATEHGKDVISILPRDEMHPRRIPLRSTGGSTEISCGDSFITWGRGSGRGDATLYLYDIATKKKTELGTTRAYGRVRAQGDTLAYPEKTDGSRPARWVVATWRP
ncbi:hypothetical protein [Janibacter melonis]|uniref:hypothetical protein n=1 Tax=Janibacter melonis TaxID=262209 RepID=UPI00174CD116|nr:hypothetical protein [Janibacter melonis]